MNFRLVLGAILSLPAIASADEVRPADTCLQQYYIHAYEQALPACNLAAQEGDGHAMYILGMMSLHGNGMEANRSQAINWFSKSAEVGYQPAQYKMHFMRKEKKKSSRPLLPIKQHDAVAQPAHRTAMLPPLSATTAQATAATGASSPHPASDENRLFRHYLEKALSGDSHARYLLGLMYYEGRGVAKDEILAANMFMLSAKQGLTESQHAIGLMYYQGSGLPQNTDKAMQWLEKAARHGHIDAAYCLGQLYAAGTTRKDRQEAAAWWQTAARAGHPLAQHNLAVLYLQGEAGLERDPDKALQWFIREAEQGDPAAQFNLAHMYRIGTWGKDRNNEAANWYYRAGESWLGRGDIMQAKKSLENIRALKNHHNGPIANAFLADALSRQITQTEEKHSQLQTGQREALSTQKRQSSSRPE